MAQLVYGIMVDYGDGSGGMRWYCNTSEEQLLEMIEEDPDSYWGNEGSISQKLTFPDYLDLSLCGFRFQDRPVVKPERRLP